MHCSDNPYNQRGRDVQITADTDSPSAVSRLGVFQLHWNNLFATKWTLKSIESIVTAGKRKQQATMRL